MRPGALPHPETRPPDCDQLEPGEAAARQPGRFPGHHPADGLPGGAGPKGWKRAGPALPPRSLAIKSG